MEEGARREVKDLYNIYSNYNILTLNVWRESRLQQLYLGRIQTVYQGKRSSSLSREGSRLSITYKIPSSSEDPIEFH